MGEGNDEKEKSEISASFFTEVFSITKKTDRALQRSADEVKERLKRAEDPIGIHVFPDIYSERMV